MIMETILPQRENDRENPQNVRDMTESQKALELRKFFAPAQFVNPENEEGFNASLNNDGALDAYIETVIWRLKGTHAMVSLIDRGTQFFLAGATRRIEDDEEVLSDSSAWFGCSTVPTPGGLCENTLALDESSTEFPCFIVPDLSKDERFASLPVVDGSIASYRFYAGTPITTRQGINIGSLFLFDSKPRGDLSHTHRKFLHAQAANIMIHLETKREAAERRRGALMSKGIANFLERTSRSEAIADESNATDDSEIICGGRLDGVLEDADAPAKKFNASTTQATGSTLDKIRLTLDEAANILRESLELSAGGVVFLDPTVGSSDSGNSGPYIDTTKDLRQQVPGLEGAEEKIDHPNQNSHYPGGHGELGRHLSSSTTRSSTDKHKPAKVLAMSAATKATWDSRSRVLDGKTLQTLINSYPKGNVWYIDDEGYFSSLEQMQVLQKAVGTTPNGTMRTLSPSKLTKQRAEAIMLSKVFHQARQIMFLPLWDAGGDRWYAGCFVWSQTAVPVFTVDSEISYLSAFTNSVMVEISRLDAITANKVKSDFISSISHEFRSPLHGILASAEFLRDSQLDAAQSEFISTIQNCGGTLLDTINHVLDYSKINSFETSGHQKESTGITNELYQVADLALLCEDLINGMIAASEYNVPSATNGRTETRQLSDDKTQLAIILDMESRDWEFMIQAGALRRVVMNIFGNAQKYTHSGYILVQLRVIDSPVQNGNGSGRRTKALRLNIRDSGRGMSSEYMERKLYQPFAQEDSFAPGVGLGLSIVWSIVNQLGGKIHVRSEVGKGTDVEVTLPLDTANGSEELSVDVTDSIYASVDGKETLKRLRQCAPGKSVSIYRVPNPKPPHTDLFWDCVKCYCKDWFGFEIKPSGGDICITNEQDLSKHLDSKKVIVVHKRMVGPIKREQSSFHVTDISLPVGPFKLAKIILDLLDQHKSSRSTNANQTDAETQTPAGSPEERRIMNGIIVPDYGFPPSSLSEALAAAESAEPQAGSSLLSNPTQAHMATDNVAEMGTSSLQLPPIPISSAEAPKPTASSNEGLLLNRPEATPQTTTETQPVLQEVVAPKEVSPVTNLPPGLHILAVDDNAVNLQLLKRFLQKRRSDTIVTARNGVEAVEAYKNVLSNPRIKGQTFDVIFMDISMPEMDGFEATRVIRRLEFEVAENESDALVNDGNARLSGRGKGKPHAYVVALTGLASRRDRDEAVDSGLDGFLTKPVSFAKIGDLLKRLEKEKEAQGKKE